MVHRHGFFDDFILKSSDFVDVRSSNDGFNKTAKLLLDFGVMEFGDGLTDLGSYVDCCRWVGG